MKNLTRTRTRRTLVAFSPAALFLAFAIVMALTFERTERARGDVDRTRAAGLAAERVFADLTDAQGTQRGYLLTGGASYLENYRAALARLDADTQALRLRLSDSSQQLPSLDSLQFLIGRRMAALERGIALFQSGDRAGATGIVQSGTGKLYMDEIRRVMAEMIQREEAAMQASVGQDQRYRRALVVLFSIGTVVVLLIGIYLNRALLRYLAEQAETARFIAEQNELLQEQNIELEAQQEQLQQQNIELEVQQEQLQNQTLELEMQQEQLQRYAGELEQANDELRRGTVVLESARHEAEQANRAKTQFLAAMSHELRTPLNAIGGYVDLIHAGVYGEANHMQLDALQRVRANQQHLLGIISDIMSYAGLAAGKQEVKPEFVHLEPLLQEVEQIIHPAISEKRIHFSAAPLTNGAGVAYADRARVRQILVNLLSNAVKFTPAGGVIRLGCRGDSDVIEIDVQDTGSGIAASELDAIFEPFVQLERHRHEAEGRGGLGLGLAISRELARGMGGDVVVASAPGQGSIFTLRVPRAPGPRGSSFLGGSQTHAR